MIWAGYALLGLLAGALSGLLGIGGAVLIVPALVFIFKYSQHQAQGTSLATLLLPIGFLAAWRYWQAGHVNIRPAIIMAGAFFLGGWLGAQVAERLSSIWLQRGFGILLLAISLKMIFVR
jgi:uncharacterized membrane protein YfcA